MQHTTNYNLNQWEADDRVTRADVNADNAKIDAALTGLDAAIAGIEPSPLVKVWDTTLTEDTTALDIDVSSLNLNGHSYTLLWADSPAGGGCKDFHLRVNGMTSGYRRGQNDEDYLGRGGHHSALFVLRPKASDTLCCMSWYINSNRVLIREDCCVKAGNITIQTLNLYTDSYSTFHTGMRFVLYTLDL